MTTHARPRAPGYSFCIIHDGRRPARLLEEIASVRALALPAFEIIVAGEVTVDLPDVTVLQAPQLARGGHLGAMRNLACSHAQFDHLVVADDDMIFHRDFTKGLRALDDTTDVLCVRLLNPDGSRYWDWATFGGPRGHVLLDYHEHDDFVYVTGGLAIMKAAVHDQVQWDGVRGFYAGEDLDWSARVRAAGLRIRFCADATVTHNDPRYTQRGPGIVFRQDLAVAERIVTGVEGRGFFRPLEVGFRWMSDVGTLLIASQDEGARTLRFALASVAPALLETPFQVAVLVNDVPAGSFTFAGTQSFSAALPVPAGSPLRVQLTSNRSTSAREVGLHDERPVSVLLHDVSVTAASS